MPTSATNPEFVHNEYLQLLADYGLGGLLLILGLLVGHLWIGGKLVCSLLAGVCGMVAMSVHIIFDFRTHLLANLLLLVCCAVWVLPVAKSEGQRSKVKGLGVFQFFSVSVGGVMLCVLSFGAVALGGYQLWGGGPLLEHKMAKEDGTWEPEKVDRKVLIPVLEESISRAPTYGRLLRLGTLYRLEAEAQSGELKERFLEKAKVAYKQSTQRNPFNPISRINAAQIEEASGNLEEADRLYASASEMAKVRERWFRMYLDWGRLHYRWALDLWKAGKVNEAEEHFKQSVLLYDESRQLWGGAIYDEKWASGSLSSEIFYARLLDEQKKFDEADEHFKQLRKRRGWNWMMGVTQGEWFQSLHYYEMGRNLWMSRKPQAAHQLMEESKQALIKQNRRDHGQDLETRKSQMKKIQEVIDFFEKAGVKTAR